MLPKVETPIQKLEEYKGLILKELFEEIESLAKPLKNLKVIMVNSTPRGGGVAEVLKSLIPLMKGAGIKAEWYTIPPRDLNFSKEILKGYGIDPSRPLTSQVSRFDPIQNGKNGFLVSSPEELAKRIVQLIRNPQLAEKLGKAARETVKEKFLMPRLLRDYVSSNLSR